MQQKTRRLTERQKRFAEYYLQLGNASEAAVRAGFKRSYAQAAKRQPAVQAYMQERMKELAGIGVASSNEVLSFLTDVMRGEYGKEFAEKCTSSRVRAATMLGRRFELF